LLSSFLGKPKEDEKNTKNKREKSTPGVACNMQFFRKMRHFQMMQRGRGRLKQPNFSQQLPHNVYNIYTTFTRPNNECMGLLTPPTPNKQDTYIKNSPKVQSRM
jgi:hypothetical protein